MEQSLPRAYSEDEAAKLLTNLGWTISRRTLQRMRFAGSIPHHQLGGRVWYTDDDIRQIIIGSSRGGGQNNSEPVVAEKSVPPATRESANAPRRLRRQARSL